MLYVHVCMKPYIWKIEIAYIRSNNKLKTMSKLIPLKFQSNHWNKGKINNNKVKD